MVRDLIIDIKEHDLSLTDKSSSATPIFNCLWGNVFDEDEAVDTLICNILVPEAYWNIVKYSDNNEFICKFVSPYIPDTRHFRVRMIAFKDGGYSLFSTIRGDFGVQVVSYALSRNIASPIPASMLSYINIDGIFQMRFVRNEKSEIFDKAYIYSGYATDLEVSFSDNQAAQLLSLNGPGHYYRYPTSGVGITKYLNAVISHSNLFEKLEEQFEKDSRILDSAEFDNANGDLGVLFEPEKEESDNGLMDIENLNTGFFDRFTDDFVRQNTVITEVDENLFFDTLNEYDYMMGLYLFVDETTTSQRVADRYIEGAFDSDGNIIPSDEYIIVSATLEPDTIIMFDDETEDDVKGSPIFIINDNDETRLYTSLVEQVFWVTEECHKCFILKKRAEVRYMIHKDQFLNEKGLYIVPQTSANIKNMLGLVQDIATGRILGIVSSSTNINDMTMDEITNHIYALI